MQELALANAQNRKLQDIILNGFEEVVRHEAKEQDEAEPPAEPEDGEEESKIEKKLREDGLADLSNIGRVYGDAGAQRP